MTLPSGAGSGSMVSMSTSSSLFSERGASSTSSASESGSSSSKRARRTGSKSKKVFLRASFLSPTSVTVVLGSGFLDEGRSRLRTSSMDGTYSISYPPSFLILSPGLMDGTKRTSVPTQTRPRPPASWGT